jgi:hypothetical protein
MKISRIHVPYPVQGYIDRASSDRWSSTLCNHMKWFINRGEIKREREREAQPVQHVLILQ